MGMGALIGIGAAASIGGDVYKGIEQSEANEQQQYQLQLQMSQTKAKAEQDSIARSKKNQQVQATALALQGASGMSLQSANFQNQQEQSYQTFAEDQQIGNMNLMANEAAIQSRMDAANSMYHNQLFGDALDIGKTTIGAITEEESGNDSDDFFKF